jgi:isopenicillin N synthase-like dioxygenase
MTGPNQWPAEEDLPRFRHLVEIYFNNMRELVLILNQHLSEHLGVPLDLLEDYFPTEAQFTAILWHYFPVTPEIRREAKDGFARGIHEHRDPSTFLNLLIQNRIGLQAQNHQGAWIDIPMVEGGVVFNIGGYPGHVELMAVFLRAN